MRATATLAAALSLAGAAACKEDKRDHRSRLPRRLPPAVEWVTDARLLPRAPTWSIQIAAVSSVPDVVAHPPLFVGDRVIIAGSRVGYVALDAATGALAWQRPGGVHLGNPVSLGRDVALVHDCEGAVAAPEGQVTVACLERIDVAKVAARTERPIVVDEASAAECTGSLGAWQVRTMLSADEQLEVVRGACRLGVDATSGQAHPLPADRLPLPDEENVVLSGRFGTWRRVTHDDASYLEWTNGLRDLMARIPGLTVLAFGYDDAAPDQMRYTAAVVRRDASLTHDELISIDGRWKWPLPSPPAGGRATPCAVGTSADAVVVFFDGDRVALFADP